MKIKFVGPIPKKIITSRDFAAVPPMPVASDVERYKNLHPPP